MIIYTIGHSNHSTEKFIDLLGERRSVVDIRAHPGSSFVPHFSKGMMNAWLTLHGFNYRWLPELGGRRKPTGSTENNALRNESFRGFADYMQTDEFKQGVKKLTNGDVIMCAEAVPWKCHRNLISDWLVARFVEVYHIMPDGLLRIHKISTDAKVLAGAVIYPKKKVGAYEG